MELYIPLHYLIYSKLLNDCTGEKRRTNTHLFSKSAVARYLVNCIANPNNHFTCRPETEIALHKFFRYFYPKKL
ncbi:MAG: hypothetical protein D3925_09105 [Candidatus Electrothrix sp. AR5]|nr:hypothetical protein [Candidatus Electrothrix sp. AR5]